MTRKTRTYILVTMLACASFSVTPVFAQGFGDTLKTGLNTAAPNELKGVDDPTIVIGSLISTAIAVLGAVLLIYLIWAGYTYMTAGGEAGKVQEAKDRIRNAIIGIVIVALSYSIASYVIDRLDKATGGGGQTQEVPPGGPGT